MKTFKYQMHMHTKPCSACGYATAEEMVEFLFNGGFQGGVITNHFKGGNTGIDRKLLWNDFVKPYEDDYIKFKETAKKYDMDILFGIEQGVGGGKEILVYGLTPKMLYDYPELNTSSPEVWYKTLKPYGVLIYQAHPFRRRNYITDVRVMDENIDGIEVFNFCNTLNDNMDAEEYAENHKELLLIAGGDAHGQHACCNGGIETAKRIKTNEELVDILKRGAFNLIKE